MENGLISVVAAAYNSERYIVQAADSVIRQSRTDWELLILDDCSTDGTWDRIQELCAGDARIRAFRNERNEGVGRTRNRGVELAQGAWIAFLDSDDMWTPDKLEKQLGLLARFPRGVLFFTGSGFMTQTGVPMDYVLHVPERIDRRQLLKQNLLSCSSVLVRRETMLRHPFPAGRGIHEDFAAWLAILEEEAYAYGVDEPLLIYRRSDTSKSANKLKAARMNWNTYREAGLGPVSSLYYMAWYTVRGLQKYSKLR